MKEGHEKRKRRSSTEDFRVWRLQLHQLVSARAVNQSPTSQNQKKFSGSG